MTFCLQCKNNNNIISYFPLNNQYNHKNKLNDLHACIIHGKEEDIEQINILNNMRNFKETKQKFYYFPSRDCLEKSKPYFHEFCHVFEYIYKYNGIRIMEIYEHNRVECNIS